MISACELAQNDPDKLVEMLAELCDFYITEDVNSPKQEAVGWRVLIDGLYEYSQTLEADDLFYDKVLALVESLDIVFCEELGKDRDVLPDEG